MLHHYSEDPHIERFVPHVPRTNPSHAAAVWAIDSEHAPLYWFPRDCPRIAMWPRRVGDLGLFAERFATVAPRLHAMELAWVYVMRATALYRYDFDPAGFEPWKAADGQWISLGDVVPVNVSPVGDLLDAHARAGIELRLVPSLWPLY